MQQTVDFYLKTPPKTNKNVRYLIFASGEFVRGDVPGVGLRSVGDLDPAAQAALRCSAQIWVKQEVLKGRIVHTKKWKDKEEVGEGRGTRL